MDTGLRRGLSLIDAIAIVMGTIIGTGVFLKTSSMALLISNPTFILLAWIVGGLLSLTGALAYAELGSLMPDAGGEYVYIKKGYGELWAFLYGWMRFWIGSPGSIAAYSVGAMTFMSGIIDLDIVGGKAVAAVLVIGFFSILNCFSVSFGGRLQAFMTVLKVLVMLGIVVGIFFFSKKGNIDHFWINTPSLTHGITLSAFGSAVLAALWAFDGWCNLTMVAGEIKNPKKNIPLSLIIGMLSILVLYALINLAYFYALPLDEIITANSGQNAEALPLATKAALTFLGPSGVTLLSGALVFSALGAMNGSILTGARVPFAMARDGLFFKQLSEVHEKSRVPVKSIMIQALTAMALALSGTFDQLTDYVVFSSWIFYAMVTSVIFVLRKREPSLHRVYKAFGYPVLPMIFIILGVLLLFNTVITSPKSSLIGLSFITSGIPCYFYFKKRRNLTVLIPAVGTK